MGVYENFETIKDTLGYAHLSTENIIAKGHLSENSIAQIDKKMEDAHSVLCHFPIGYIYDENKTSYYRIALSEQFQVLKEYSGSTPQRQLLPVSCKLLFPSVCNRAVCL